MPEKLLFLQTSDPFRYYDMLQATSRTVRGYCEKWSVDYQQFVGIKRGYWPWQATFNRVSLLTELVESRRESWCIYMDADAYIKDFTFDLPAYLARCDNQLLVCTPSGASNLRYDVNVGVMGLNLKHHLAGELVARWSEMFGTISDIELKEAGEEWPVGMPDDQVMLQWILRDNDHLSSALHSASPNLMNSPNASFIRQYLRAQDRDLEARTAHVREITDQVMGDAPAYRQAPPSARGPSGVHYDLVEGLYRVILGRPTDEYGRLAFGQMIFENGLTLGVERVAELLLSGDEYKLRLRARLSPR